MKTFLCSVLLAAVFVPAVALADGPVNLALVPDVQIVGKSHSVTAFRLALWGRNVDMTGLDLAVFTETTGDFTGLQWTGGGVVHGDFSGWQNAWLVGITNGNMQGLQTAAYTHAGPGSSGVQFGLVNTADSFSGLQVGLVNVTETMRSGLQIGIVNIINNKDSLKFFPIVNWRF